MLNSIFTFVTFGIVGSKEDRELSNRIKNSYTSLDVIGRGTVVVSAKEVHQDLVASGVYDKADRLVRQRG
ncbi:hypothetical protein [Shewanella aquimarina]|uniref:hypothetical protein n=1 Tax=Shewanella aquimarina TaxID=260365 RepID=UPI0020148B86|nr:hypothetical protein [Shewanella aquimarina]MCL2910423.1 hypothetical protein [Shewanella aquimarina]